jgi:hypothetical protein
MKLLAVALLLSLPVVAQTKHQVTLGNSQAGWDGSSTTFDTDSSKGTKDYEVGLGSLNLNYAYSVTSQVQLGASLRTVTESSETKYTDGDKYESEGSTASLFVFVSYNFAEELSNAFYVTVGFGGSQRENESKDTDSGVTTKNDFNYTTRGMFVSFGKRFDLTGLGIQNLTYSPAITLEAGRISGDLKKDGVEEYTTGKLDLIKFDLLF